MASFNDNGGSNSLDMIPGSVTLGGTFRAFSNTSFYLLRQRIEEVRAVNTILINCYGQVVFLNCEVLTGIAGDRATVQSL